jgi:RimJ/RimL family protein N-acetyltransferase
VSTIATDRLILRNWRDEDRPAFFEMNADPKVMRFFERIRNRAEADAVFDRLAGEIDRNGYGFWAMELRKTGEVIGFTGLRDIDFDASFTPSVEIGWRLLTRHWSKGYATEAARASLAHGFEHMELAEIVSFAVTENWPSRRVMERIGMRREPEHDFDHPDITPGSPLARHAFYRLTAAEWRQKQSGSSLSRFLP